MSGPLGGSIPDEIVLTRDEAATVLLAIDDAVERVVDAGLRARLERPAHIIVDRALTRAIFVRATAAVARAHPPVPPA